MTEIYRRAGEAAAAIVQVLEEARQRRRSDIFQSRFGIIWGWVGLKVLNPAHDLI